MPRFLLIFCMVIPFLLCNPPHSEALNLKKVGKKITKTANKIGDEVKNWYEKGFENKVSIDTVKSARRSTPMNPKIYYTHRYKALINYGTQSKTLGHGDCATTHGLWRHCARYALPYTNGNNGPFDDYGVPDGDARKGKALGRMRLCLYEDPMFPFDGHDFKSNRMPYHHNTPCDLKQGNNLCKGVVDTQKATLAMIAGGEEGLSSAGGKPNSNNDDVAKNPEIYMAESFESLGSIMDTMPFLVASGVQMIAGYVGYYAVDWLTHLNTLLECTTQSCKASKGVYIPVGSYCPNGGCKSSDAVVGCVDLPLGFFPPPLKDEYTYITTVPQIRKICNLSEESTSTQAYEKIGCATPLSTISTFFSPKFEIGFREYLIKCDSSPNITTQCVEFKNFVIPSASPPQKVGLCNSNSTEPCVSFPAGENYGNGEYRVIYDLTDQYGIAISSTSSINTPIYYSPALIDYGTYHEMVGKPKNNGEYSFPTISLTSPYSDKSWSYKAALDEDDPMTICFYRADSDVEIACLDRDAMPTSPEKGGLVVSIVDGSTSENPKMRLTLGKDSEAQSVIISADDSDDTIAKLHGVPFKAALVFPHGHYIDHEGVVQCGQSNCQEAYFNEDCTYYRPGLETTIDDEDVVIYKSGAAFMCVDDYKHDGSLYIAKKTVLYELLDEDSNVVKVTMPSPWPEKTKWPAGFYVEEGHDYYTHKPGGGDRGELIYEEGTSPMGSVHFEDDETTAYASPINLKLCIAPTPRQPLTISNHLSSDEANYIRSLTTLTQIKQYLEANYNTECESTDNSAYCQQKRQLQRFKRCRKANNFPQ